MEKTRAPLLGVLTLKPPRREDERGYFYEVFSPSLLAEIGCDQPFVQENVSGSRKGVLRGLHYQLQPASQGKLVRASQGEIFDVVVDLRRGSPTFGRWHAITLSAANRLCLWVPPGFAHGFCVTSEFAELIYSVTRPYSPADERTILWNDRDLAIAWPEVPGGFTLSPKDRAGSALRDAEVNFTL
jgi:dTDP-4-dehydrorhamnose 3,5-epimerase